MGSRAEFVDGREHVVWPEEQFVVGIDQVAKRRLAGCQLDEFPMVIGTPLSGPGLLTALQHPEAHDVFQEPGGSIDSAFIGEIQAQCFGRDHRRI